MKRRAIDGVTGCAHAKAMIRLTLPDGTRIQIEASEITDVEPMPGGALIHRASGDPLQVMQDARTVQTRVNAELDKLAALEEAPQTAEASEIASTLVTGPAVKPPSRMERMKRIMQGRTSGLAMVVAQIAARD